MNENFTSKRSQNHELIQKEKESNHERKNGKRENANDEWDGWIGSNGSRKTLEHTTTSNGITEL